MATGLGIHTLFFDKGEEEWGFEFLDECDPSYLLPNGNIVQRKNKKIAGPKSEIQSSGTGVLLSNDGLIATCAHVVDGASRIRVKSARNTRTAEVANVILIDPQNDPALLQSVMAGAGQGQFVEARSQDLRACLMTQPVGRFRFPYKTATQEDHFLI